MQLEAIGFRRENIFSIYYLYFSILCFWSLNTSSFPYSSFPRCSFSKILITVACRTLQTAVGVFGGEGYTDGMNALPLMVANVGNSGREAISSRNSPPFIAVEDCREHFVCLVYYFFFLEITDTSNWTRSTFLVLQRIIDALFEKNWALTLILKFIHFYALKELFKLL